VRKASEILNLDIHTWAMTFWVLWLDKEAVAFGGILQIILQLGLQTVDGSLSRKKVFKPKDKIL
jgi:hypothetical protein